MSDIPKSKPTKATAVKRDGRYIVIGLQPTSTPDCYEELYLSVFAGKTFKTERGAIHAIKKSGYEHIKARKVE